MKTMFERKFFRVMLGFVLLLVFSGFATAEQASSKEALTVTLTANKVVTAKNGKETFENAEKARPGDLLEYKAVYANVSGASVDGVMASLPIPEKTEYVGSSARPASVWATVDGKTYEAVPLKRSAKDKSGKMVTELVPLSEYRGLRWSLGALGAGKTATVVARVHVAR